MLELKKGLYNYRTTITGFITIIFGAFAQAFPEWSEVFNSMASVAAMAFVVFVKDAATGSPPGAKE